MMVAMKDNVGEHPDVKDDLWPRILRGLRKPEQKRSLERLLAEISPVECYTPAGIYLGRREAYNVDLARLYKTTNRIGKAVYWRETKVLGSEIEADTVCLEDVSDPEIVRLVHCVQNANTPIVSMGGDIFQYKIVRAADKEKCAAILLNFYGVLAFFVIILPAGEGTHLPESDGPPPGNRRDG